MRFSRLSIMAVFAAFVLAVPGAHASAQSQAEDAELAAFDLEAQGNLDAAIAKHREALALTPNNKPYKENFARTLNAAGIAKYQAKDFPAAIAYFEEAIGLFPNFQTAKDNLFTVKGERLNTEGMTLFKNGDFTGALAKFNEVLALNANYKPARINKDATEAQLAMTAGDPATAVIKLREAVSLNPDSAFLKGKLAEAEAAAAAKAAEDAEK
jgi:tetratricopeptide (TPR) repeat protein